MAVPLVKHVIVIQFKKAKFDAKSAVFPGEEGVRIDVDHIRDNGKEIPIKGCVDFCLVNQGTAKAFLFNGAITILPGQSWFPQKSSPLPIVNQPVLIFEGDYQLSRSSSDLTVPASVL